MIRPLRPRTQRALALSALLLAGAACHDRGVAGPDRPTPPAGREIRVIATASARSAANDVLLVQAISAALRGAGAARSLSLRAAPVARNATSADTTYGGLSCTFNAGLGRFQCDEVALESMTIRAEYALYDANDAPQSAYDDVTTHSAMIWYWAQGTLVNPDGAAAIDRERTFTVTNLQSGAAERVFDGGGTDHFEMDVPGNPAQRYVLNDTTTADSVVVGVPFGANVWPLAGTLTARSQLDITEGGVPISTTRRRVVITFNGTQFVQMNVDDDDIYTLDLATGDLTSDP